MTPIDIWNEFNPIFEQAEMLRQKFEKGVSSIQASLNTDLATVSSPVSSNKSSVDSMKDVQTDRPRMPFVTVSI